MQNDLVSFDEHDKYCYPQINKDYFYAACPIKLQAFLLPFLNHLYIQYWNVLILSDVLYKKKSRGLSPQWNVKLGWLNLNSDTGEVGFAKFRIQKGTGQFQRL